MSFQKNAQRVFEAAGAKTTFGKLVRPSPFSSLDAFAQSYYGLALGAVGVLVVAWSLLRLLTFLLDTFVLPGIPLTRFGAKPKARGKSATWAVVTGATDGIGREFALQLAKAGFNIVLASRTAEKLKAVANEVQSQAPGVLTKVQVIDFGQGDETQYKALEDTLQGLEIGVLVNNVGRSNAIPVLFAEQPEQEVLDIAEINIMATLRVTRMVAPRLVEKKRGLILNVGSFSAQFPAPLLSTYAGTKAFLITWSQALGEEMRRSNVVVQNINTYFVVSNLSKIRRSSAFIPTPKQYVASVLAKIGRACGAVSRPYNSTPYATHALVDYVVSSTVGGTHHLLKYNFDSLMAIRKKALKRAAKTQ